MPTSMHFLIAVGRERYIFGQYTVLRKVCILCVCVYHLLLLFNLSKISFIYIYLYIFPISKKPSQGDINILNTEQYILRHKPTITAVLYTPRNFQTWVCLKNPKAKN